ncbi:PEP-CTERM protein-sorting domain-containing protein [Colwellia chukchiensis]|uniref:PEP-CTERM protein-sorting domain-containing protein n=1 Tax=Colwellia chukchiensis TaxID=641665 RepID=A0A1H7G693_9GAMM|nr:hypothetical protein [Colwellia chukchiensis]SEK33651.1 PEP-CTERM protein-sorting domain-containing protein [Colwellia chukchiensis]
MNTYLKILTTILTLITYSTSATLITTTTKIEGIFTLGTVISLTGEEVTVENVTASGAAVGLGTSDLMFASGICDPAFPPPSGCGNATEVVLGGDPNKISFNGLGLRSGAIPNGSFLIGEVTFENNDIAWQSFSISSLFLEVSAIECDLLGQNCDESTRHSGSTEVEFAFTANIPGDLDASADSICLTTELGSGVQLCAWVPEFNEASFDIYGRFGSLIVEDVIPKSVGGFVTIGTNSQQNIKYSRVPEPTSIVIFIFGLLGLLLSQAKSWVS